MLEIELKFLIDPSAGCRLVSKLKKLKISHSRFLTRNMRSIYYDTPQRSLYKMGLVIRLRNDGGRWIQCVKARSRLAGGLSRVEEFECELPDGKLDLELIPDPAARANVQGINDEVPLLAVCETIMQRSSSKLVLDDGTFAELAIDNGKIAAGDRSADLSELEIELIEGDVCALYELAQQLLRGTAVRFSRMSKADRGYLLADRGDIELDHVPRTSQSVCIHPGQTIEEATRSILRECFDQIATNFEMLAGSDDPEGPHQLRIGLRRLRSALTVLSSVVDTSRTRRLAGEARWLGRKVGILRDLDVAIHDIVDFETSVHPGEASFSTLRKALVSRAVVARKKTRKVLRNKRAQAFLFDLARFVEADEWQSISDGGQALALSAPVQDLAVVALDKRWKAVRKHARDIENLDVEHRHELRKELKQLRYAVEFLAPLYPRERVTAFVRRLKTLQTVFGDLNDAVMAHNLLSGKSAPGADDLAAQRASGLIIGLRLARTEITWNQAKSYWSDLRKSGPFWS